MYGIEKPIILCIVGSTGTGKDTIRELLKEKGGYTSIVSLTDRLMRLEDKNKKEHRFVSKDKFSEIAKTKEILAPTTYCGNRYGILMDDIVKAKLSNKIPIFIVEPTGVYWLKEHENALGFKTVVAFLDIPEKERRLRCCNRSDYKQVFDERLETDRELFDDFKNTKGYIDITCNQDSWTNARQIDSIVETYINRLRRKVLEQKSV